MGKLRILLDWRSERFALWHYGPFAMMLSGPVLGFKPGWLMLLTLSLLLQSRLCDDLASIEDDAAAHPDRVLVSLSSLSLPIAVCSLLVLINGIIICSHNLWSGIFYALFLVSQWRWLPSFVKYSALVLLIDHLAGAESELILWHVLLVASSAAAFELGHDVFRNQRSRMLYGVLVLSPLIFQPFAVIGLIRLHANLEKTRARRFLSAALPHISVALIATRLFQRSP